MPEAVCAQPRPEHQAFGEACGQLAAAVGAPAASPETKLEDLPMMSSEGAAVCRSGRHPGPRIALQPAVAGAWGPRNPVPSGKLGRLAERAA